MVFGFWIHDWILIGGGKWKPVQIALFYVANHLGLDSDKYRLDFFMFLKIMSMLAYLIQSGEQIWMYE